MGGAAAAAAGAVVRARRQVISHFMALNAVAPERAVSFTPGRRLEERQFQQLMALGVIKPASAAYYIDIPAYNAWSIDRHRREGLALTVTLLLVVLVMAALAFGVISRH